MSDSEGSHEQRRLEWRSESNSKRVADTNPAESRRQRRIEYKNDFEPERSEEVLVTDTRSRRRQEKEEDKREATAVVSTSATTFDTYTDFVEYLAARKCPKCEALLITKSADVEGLFEKWAKGDCALTPRVRCRKCDKSTCIACHDKANKDPTTIKTRGIKLEYCCSRGRLFMLWVLLCGFDQRFSAEKRKDTEAARNSRSKSRYADKGIGYGRESDSDWMAFRRGPFGNCAYPVHDEDKISSAMSKAERAEKAVDSFNFAIISFLTALLPSPDEDSNFDVDPPGAVLSMLLHSKVFSKAAELLRNDSLDNAAKRKDLYDALLGLLRIIGTHEALSERAMFKERWIFPDAVNLLTLSFQGVPKGAQKESSSSLVDILRTLNTQSTLMIKGALNNKKEFDSTDGKDLLWLCRKIADLATYLLGKDASSKAAADCGVTDTPDDDIYPTYRYAREAYGLSSSPRGRIKRLITEITTLKTGLSQGIFVKHAATRLDVMKVLIIGPEGTPYEHGLFEFDLFCPVNYPHMPPKVYFRGYEGIYNCDTDMNPNLHRDGTVCLSLLGTFRGEQWRPGKSTILQVLISIQAMIFCENPQSNEPGFDGSYPHNNKYYNLTVQTDIIRFILIKWAENPPKLWKEVATKYFRNNGNKILRMVERWARESHMLAEERDLLSRDEKKYPATLPQRLQNALQRYGATYQIREFRELGGGRRPFPSGRDSGGGSGFRGYGRRY